MISVIIPVYNNYTTLKACLDSVKAQEGVEFEIVVVDDGSRDSDAIRSIVGEYSNIQYIRQDNQGAPAARNRGFADSRGEYVIFLDADIVMKSHMLRTMQEVLQSKRVQFCYSAFKLGLKTMPMVAFDQSILRQYNYIHTSSLMVREAFPGFDTRLKRFQDWDLWLTIIERGGAGVGIPEYLFTISTADSTISEWLPKIVYKFPWQLLGYTPKVVERYLDAKRIIQEKHNLPN